MEKLTYALLVLVAAVIIVFAIAYLVIWVISLFEDDQPSEADTEFAAEFDAVQAEREREDCIRRLVDAEQQAARLRNGPLHEGQDL